MAKKKKFKCKECGNIREVGLWGEINHPHLFGKKLLMKCPKCDKVIWHVKVEEEK